VINRDEEDQTEEIETGTEGSIELLNLLATTD